MAGHHDAGRPDAPQFNWRAFTPDDSPRTPMNVMADPKHQDLREANVALVPPRSALSDRSSCPSLVLLGEHDVMFIKASELLARTIPDVKHLVMPGLGHMTAIEDPEGTLRELLDFLGDVGS